MAATAYRLLSMVMGAGLVLGFSGFLWAQAPDISIALNFDKETYEYGEPIPVEVVVTNNSSSGILLNRGFKATDFYLEMRVIDPAQRLVVAAREDFHDEFPDAPPLAWILHNGKPIRVAGCESLDPGALPPSYTADLRDHFDILLPGYYSAQVQVSAMVFEGAPCEADAYGWQGVLSSQTRYFYVQASNQVTVEGSSAPTKVVPDEWNLDWLKDKGKPNKVQVEIKLQGDLEIADFELDSIKLNNVTALKVEIKKKKIMLEYDRKLLVESLGDVNGEIWHRVLISGWLKSGAPFGAEHNIKLEASDDNNQ